MNDNIPFQTNLSAPGVFPASPACLCHGAITSGRGLLVTGAESTRIATDATTSIRLASGAISWQGNAASLFRRQLTACVARGEGLRDDTALTLRLSWNGGL